MVMRPRFGFATSIVLALAFLSAAPAYAQAEGACPNESLRLELNAGRLPDCRAYELVSPTYTEGIELEINAISEDGSRVIGRSTGSFAGTKADSFYNDGASYEIVRTSSGWTASSLDPPAAQSPTNAFLGASRDLSTSVWQLRNPSQSIYESDLYLREPSGSFTRVGPLVPLSAASGPRAGTEQEGFEGNIRYAGASSDLSHVLLSYSPGGQTTFLWPGDTTLPDEESLYDYATPAAPRPELVGVNSNGQQISSCGTRLGAHYDKYNAVSASGERVFFEAQPGGCEANNENGELLVGAGPEVAELYARVGRVGTVAISEPTYAQCRECRTTVKAPAEFGGASEDGSKVFFTTEQELFGRQTTENLYEYDFSRPVGEKIVLVSRGAEEPQVQGVMRVSEDGSHVYFVAKGVLAGTNGEGYAPVAGAENMYLFEPQAGEGQGRMAFVTVLSEGDSEDWQTSDDRPVQATPDGMFLVFRSQSQVFEYDAGDERLVNISGGHEAQIPRPNYIELDSPTAALSRLAVSNDGAYVVLTSKAQLTTQPVVGTYNVYEYHSSGSVAAGTTSLISDGKDLTAEGAALQGTDATGADIFFQSGDPLVQQDTDTQVSLYDARIGGGFPAPTASVGCEGEACQGALPSVPLFGSPGSVASKGGGNLTPPSVSEPVVKTKPKAAPLTRSQKRSRALSACRRDKSKRRRVACETLARKRYGGKSKVYKGGK